MYYRSINHWFMSLLMVGGMAFLIWFSFSRIRTEIWSSFPFWSVIFGLIGLAALLALFFAFQHLKQLCSEKDRLRRLADSATEAIIIHQDGQIRDANLTATRLLGYQLDELIGKPILMLAAPISQPLFSERLAGNSEQPYEIIGVRRDQVTIPLEAVTRSFTPADPTQRATTLRDATAHKLVEAALRSSDSRFRQLASHINHVFWMYSPKLDQAIYVSPAYETVWGQSCASLYEHPQAMFEAIHPDDHERSILPNNWELFPDYAAEYRIITPNGAIRWIWTHAFPIRNEQGQIYRIAGISEDITAWKEAEAALRESAETIRNLYSIAAEPQANFMDRVHALLSMGCNRFQLPIGALIQIEEENMHILDIITPLAKPVPGDVLPLADSFCHETLKSGTVLAISNAGSSEWRLAPCYSRSKVEAYFGAPVIVRGKIYGEICFASPNPRSQEFSDNDQDMLRLMAQWISGEIDRNQAEEQLAQQYQVVSRAQSESQAVFNATNDGMALLSPTGVFRAVNRRFGELFGVNPSQLLGQLPQALDAIVRTQFENPEQVRAALSNISTGDKRQGVILVQSAPEPHELVLYSSLVYDQETCIGRLLLIRDMTNERAVDRMKSEFVAMVSHELRTPLTSIKGYADIMLEGEVGAIAPVQAEFLEIIKSNADRLVKLISDLLDVGKIDSGHITLHYRQQNIRTIIERTVRLLDIQITQKKQHLTIELPDSLPPLWCDGEYIQQALTNLLSNAHKYTTAGGSITISASANEQTMMIVIHDTGIGIAPEDQERIFARFSQVNTQAMKEVGGTGLGLTIARGLIELHQGSLQVESQLGIGSTFLVQLPLRQPE